MTVKNYYSCVSCKLKFNKVEYICLGRDFIECWSCIEENYTPAVQDVLIHKHRKKIEYDYFN